MNPQTPENEIATPRWVVNMSEDGHHYLWDDRKYDNYDLRTLCHILNEYEEKTNEGARLREEAKNWHQHYRDEASKAQKCKQAYIEQEKEIARLREEKEYWANQWNVLRQSSVSDVVKAQEEVARLREELADIKDGMKFIMDEKCAESEVHCGCVPLLKISFKEAEEENQKLRESLVKMIQRNNKLEMELSKAEARLAPAPEETQDGATMAEWYGGFTKIESTEPVNPTCSNTTHKFSHCDCTEPAPDKNTELNTDQPVSNSEWRQLGQEEVICEGDEIQWPYKDWQTAKSSIGYKVGYWDGLVKARTRRPLPVIQDSRTTEPEWREFTIDQEPPQAGDEWRHEPCNPHVWWKVHGAENWFDNTTVFRTLRPFPKVQEEPYHWPDFCTCEKCKPKQEEMPLERDIKDLENISIGKWGAPETRRIAAKTAHAIRYLRDEIQKLKAK